MGMRLAEFTPSRRGFTLVEIILVMAIGVVLAGGAAVLLLSTPGDRELDAARALLEEAASAAREQALSTGQSQRVSISSTAVNGQSISPEVEMSLSTPARKAWTQYRDGYEWLFTGGGLVEPIRVRLRHGPNTAQFSFSALTGESITETPERL